MEFVIQIILDMAPLQDQYVFVGCFEISISVFVKHVQNTRIIRAFCLPEGDLLRFLVPGSTEEIAGLWFARGGVITQADTMDQKSFSINNKLGLIDTFQFLSSALYSFVKNLTKDDFKYSSQELDNNVLDLVKQKGLCPYEYMTDFKNLHD